MKTKIYNILVNNHIGIKERYHRVHDGSTGAKKLLSWVYLLWLNLCYYIFFCRFLDQPLNSTLFEDKNLLLNASESASRMTEGMTVEEVVNRLSQYDVVSFDIFDTLILRPFDEPTMLFYFLGETLGYMDFRRIRIEAENDARWEMYKREESFEVSLGQIWDKLEEKTGLSANKGMQLEMDMEMKYCYANPFMKQVFEQLVAMKKHIVITSDMYLSKKFLNSLLELNGYIGYQQLYVSNEVNKCKGNGELFDYVIRDQGITPKQMIHIGDNERSDIQMAKKRGIATCYYPNVHKKIILYRAYDLSPIIGGAYRGIVDNHLYCGLGEYSMEYEYGYIYGGLFALGYCSFIHQYCHSHNVDKILFLSRDGDILKQVYDRMYPGEPTEYVYWSRKAATKLMACEDRYDYFRRFLDHKVNQNNSLEKVFASMELSDMLPDVLTGIGGKHQPKEELTDSNVKLIKKYMLGHWDEVLAHYAEEHEVASEYYGNILQDCHKAMAVDIGWAGSGAIALDHLVQKVWNIPCEIIGMIAGTNTIHNFEPFASETFLQSGKLVSYLYSMSHNRDLMKRHDPNKDYNVYWELLLSSPTRQFAGFGKDGFKFGDYDENLSGIREIQKGILDFVDQYMEHFGDLPYMLDVSGRDAYGPMLVAASKNERYLKAINKKFALDINVN